MRVAAFVALLLAWPASVAIALLPAPVNDYIGQGELVIREDLGGRLDLYMRKYEQLRRAGTKVVIDGPCASACTLLFTLPRHQVCATRRAELGFHSATFELNGQWSLDGSLIMWKAYPESVRQLLRARGWRGTNPHPKMIYLRASKLLPICAPAQ